MKLQTKISLGVGAFLMLLLAVIIGCAASVGVAPPSNRFTVISKEQHDDFLFYVIEDNTTHQEVVCVYGGLAAPSCYPTGRTIVHK